MKGVIKRGYPNKEIPSILLKTNKINISYSVYIFQAKITKFFEYTSCFLCGEIHALRIHAYLPRLIRGNDEQNITITIFSIYCLRAKKQGRQYTIRILPPFVIPECNISFTNVLAYIIRYQNSTINYDEAAYILGTYDERTIKKHIQRAWEIIRKTIFKCLLFMSTLPGFMNLPAKKPQENLLDYVEKLTDEIHNGHIRMGMSPLLKPAKDIYIHTVYWFEKSRNPIRCTLSRVFPGLHFYDTS